MLAQVRPPSRVRRRETVQVGHVAPRTQPVCSETKVTEAGEKPFGTGPPAGPVAEGVVVGVGTVAVGDAVTVAVGEAMPVVGVGVGLGCVPVAVFELHPAPSATMAAMARTWQAHLPLNVTVLSKLPIPLSTNHGRPASYGSGTTRRCSSLSWASSTASGAPVSRSVNEEVFGKAITSRMLSLPASRATIRSMPRAMPPCGGAP